VLGWGRNPEARKGTARKGTARMVSGVNEIAAHSGEGGKSDMEEGEAAGDTYGRVC